MEKVSEFLINILKIFMAVLFSILLISSFSTATKMSGDAITNVFFIVEIFMLLFGSFAIFSDIRHKYKIVGILIMALILRLAWIFTVNTMPVSDFGTMYESAKSILMGNFESLKNYEYLARFPHLIPMTFYIAGVIKIFPANALLALKILNAFFSTLSVYLLYKLSDDFIRSEKMKLFVLLIGAVFPAFITYTSVLCTENLAIPLYLITMLEFFKAKDVGKKYFFVVGVFLYFSNLFRGVAVVFLIAFIIYLFLNNQKNKYSTMLVLIIGYFITAVFVSGVLLKFGVIERPLWDGAEPSYATLLLKGSNFESNGTWNIEDAMFVEEHLTNDNLSELCFEKVKARIQSKSCKELFEFYFGKFISQWMIGDCSGTYWAYTGANISFEYIVPFGFQYIYTIVVLLSIVGIFKKGNNSLICVILFGFMLLFTIIETQSRYSYIIIFSFIILAVQGIEIISEIIKKGHNNGWKLKEIFR